METEAKTGLTPLEEEMLAALRGIERALICRAHTGDDRAHYCPNCDNSLYDPREIARTAIGRAERAAPPTPSATIIREFDNELSNHIKITIEGPTSITELMLTPMEADKLGEALHVHRNAPLSDQIAPSAIALAERSKQGGAS